MEKRRFYCPEQKTKGRLMPFLSLSVFFHILLLSIGVISFSGTPEPKKSKENMSNVILVNMGVTKKIDSAKIFAQANMDGGGNVDNDVVSGAMISEKGKGENGSNSGIAQKQSMSSSIQTEMKNNKSIVTSKETEKKVEKGEDQDVIAAKRIVEELEARQASLFAQKKTLIDTSLKNGGMDGIAGELTKDLEEYAKRPRKKHIGAKVQEHELAFYVDAWKQKVERVGTLNYPGEPGARLSGTVLLTVELSRQGVVLATYVDRSSGHKVLDEAAQRIVRQASPFGDIPVSESIKGMDVLVITKAWTFSGDYLSAK